MRIKQTSRADSTTVVTPSVSALSFKAGANTRVSVAETGGVATVAYNIDAGPGVTYFVDTDAGSDSNDGLSWDTAFVTMSKAFTTLDSGDTVFFKGKVKEQLTTPVQKFDVTIIGASNRPRHADSTPDGGQSGASWGLPDVPSTTLPLVKVMQQGWQFVNILFAGPSAGPSILFFRDGGADDDERDASHGEVHNCRFASGKNGIEYSGGPFNLGIYGCWFHDLTDYAILYTAGAGVGNLFAYEVIGNHFRDCDKWILHAGKEWTIKDNVVVKITTPGIDTSAGDGGNVVVGNYFDIAAADFDPVGGFTADATDVWSNTLLNAIETGVPAN